MRLDSHQLNPTWQEALEQYRAAKLRIDELSSKDLEEKGEALCDELVRTRDQLLNLPSPDRGALLTKLELVLQDDGSPTTTPWEMSALEQTKEDMRRLLGSDMTVHN